MSERCPQCNYWASLELLPLSDDGAFGWYCRGCDTWYTQPAPPAPAAPPYDPEGVNESIRQQLRDQAEHAPTWEECQHPECLAEKGQAAAPEGTEQLEEIRRKHERGEWGPWSSVQACQKALREAYSAGQTFCTAHTQVYERVQVLEERLLEAYRKGQENMKLRALEEISGEGYGHDTGDMLNRILESVSALAALTEDSNAG